jgi:hypothetical protein
MACRGLLHPALAQNYPTHSLLCFAACLHVCRVEHVACRSGVVTDATIHTVIARLGELVLKVLSRLTTASCSNRSLVGRFRL